MTLNLKCENLEDTHGFNQYSPAHSMQTRRGEAGSIALQNLGFRVLKAKP